MLLTVSAGSLSCLVMKSLTDFSGSSVGCSGMPVKTKLSVMLRACMSRIVPFIVLFSAITEVSWVVIALKEYCSDLFSYFFSECLSLVLTEFQAVTQCLKFPV